MILFLGYLMISNNISKNFIRVINHEPIFMIMVQTQNCTLSHSHSLFLKTPYPIPMPTNKSRPVPRGTSAG